MNEHSPTTDIHPTRAQHTDAPAQAPLQPWTKPGFERMPLKGALTGSSPYNPTDAITYGIS